MTHSRASWPFADIKVAHMSTFMGPTQKAAAQRLIFNLIDPTDSQQGEQEM